jgi:hypothetical protein
MMFDTPPAWLETAGWKGDVGALSDELIKHFPLKDEIVQMTPEQFKNLIAHVWITGKED